MLSVLRSKNQLPTMLGLRSFSFLLLSLLCRWWTCGLCCRRAGTGLVLSRSLCLSLSLALSLSLSLGDGTGGKRERKGRERERTLLEFLSSGDGFQKERLCD